MRLVRKKREVPVELALLVFNLHKSTCSAGTPRHRHLKIELKPKLEQSFKPEDIWSFIKIQPYTGKEVRIATPLLSSLVVRACQSKIHPVSHLPTTILGCPINRFHGSAVAYYTLTTTSNCIVKLLSP